MRDNGTRTTEYGYSGGLPTVFGYFFFAEPLAYTGSVHCFALQSDASAVTFCFGLFLLFHFFTRTSFISLFNRYVHLGKYVHIFIRTNHARNTTAVPSPVDSIGHKTGTRRDQVKNTRLCKVTLGVTPASLLGLPLMHVLVVSLVWLRRDIDNSFIPFAARRRLNLGLIVSP